MKYLLATVLFLSQLTLGHAADAAKSDDYTKMRQNLAKVMTVAQPDSITPSPIEGLYEVVYGSQIFYATKDGAFLVQGDIIDVNGQSNVTDERRTGTRLNAINKLSEDKMVIFTPKKVKHTITVFTDIDCGYCRKMHNEIDTYLKEGIRVRYLSMPRAGLNSPSYDKAVSVWCAKDKQAAMTAAKNNDQLEKLTCANPVQEEMELADELGVTGTPTIITDSGRLLPGYMPAGHLAQLLEKDSKQN